MRAGERGSTLTAPPPVTRVRTTSHRPHAEFGINLSIPWNAGTREEQQQQHLHHLSHLSHTPRLPAAAC